MLFRSHLLASGTPETFREALPGVVLQVLTPKRRQVMEAMEALQPLDLFGEGEHIRVRFPEQPAEPLVARIAALPGVERVEPSEPTLEDSFLHALSEREHAREAAHA